jgi:hypothetical protein
MGTAASLRTHLRSHVGVSPAAYRRTFRGTGQLIGSGSGRPPERVL